MFGGKESSSHVPTSGVYKVYRTALEEAKKNLTRNTLSDIQESPFTKVTNKSNSISGSRGPVKRGFLGIYDEKKQAFIA